MRRTRIFYSAVRIHVISICIIFLITASGCAASVETFYRTGLDRRVYENINLKDGVNRKEAIILAQRTLLNSKYSDKYLVSRPTVGFDEEYNLWGVSFEYKNNDYDDCGYTVIINKDTGKIEDGCFNP